MSSQQSSSSRPTALPKTYFSNMVFLLRRANTRYAEAAASFRRAYQPTHHARTRAQKLQLSVSIDAAKAIDPRQVSVVPLPVLETPGPALPAPVPYQTAAGRRSSQRPVLEPLVIPGEAVVGREREIKRLSEVVTRRPVLRCDIPQEVVSLVEETLSSCVSASLETPASDVEGSMRTEIVPSASLVARRNVLTSRWSATDSELSVTVDTSSIQIEDSELSAIVCSSDYDESMTDLETSSPVVAERVWTGAGRVVFLPAADRQVKPPTPSVRSRKNPSIRLDAPMDITDRYSWSSDILYLQSGSSPSSSSSSSTGGPITPECPYTLPLLAFQVPKADASQPRPRISSVKRKCSESFIDMGYGEGEAREQGGRDRVASAEKRTKYQRKHWMNPAAAALRGSGAKRSAGSSFWQ